VVCDYYPAGNYVGQKPYATTTPTPSPSPKSSPKPTTSTKPATSTNNNNGNGTNPINPTPGISTGRNATTNGSPSMISGVSLVLFIFSLLFQ